MAFGGGGEGGVDGEEEATAVDEDRTAERAEGGGL